MFVHLTDLSHPSRQDPSVQLLSLHDGVCRAFHSKLNVWLSIVSPSSLNEPFDDLLRLVKPSWPPQSLHTLCLMSQIQEFLRHVTSISYTVRGLGLRLDLVEALREYTTAHGIRLVEGRASRIRRARAYQALTRPKSHRTGRHPWAA